MFVTKQLEEIAKKLHSVLPDNIQAMDAEMHQKFQDVLTATFNKLDLVTREEFDVQVKVLARTRDKVEKLEQEIARLSTIKE